MTRLLALLCGFAAVLLLIQAYHGAGVPPLLMFFGGLAAINVVVMGQVLGWWRGWPRALTLLSKVDLTIAGLLLAGAILYPEQGLNTSSTYLLIAILAAKGVMSFLASEQPGGGA